MTTTRSAAVLAAAACLAVLTGCASHAAAPGAGATRSPSTSTTAPTSAPAGTPATTAPGGQASAPRCHTSQLSLAFTGLNAASDGQRGMSLILTNHSGSICHVYGYPGLAFFDGLPMATHLTWVKESHATVVLHPGGNAQALLTWRANTATGPAPFNPNIVHVTPPDEHAYLLAVWPGGPVRGGDIAAWPLRAAPAGPFPAGTGTVSGPPGHLTGQPGLADPARPGHRHQPVLPQQPRHLAHRPGPADEAGQRGREAMHATSRSGRLGHPHARTITAGRSLRTARRAGRSQGCPPRTKRSSRRWSWPRSSGPLGAGRRQDRFGALV